MCQGLFRGTLGGTIQTRSPFLGDGDTPSVRKDQVIIKALMGEKKKCYHKWNLNFSSLLLLSLCFH